MPTDIEELLEFLHHGNTQIRGIACENLVQYSNTEPSIFQNPSLAPIKDLKVLVKDYEPIAKNALTVLINISNEQDVLQELVGDDAFLETILLRICKADETNANEFAMLLANLAKAPSIERLVEMRRSPTSRVPKSDLALNQLLDVFVRGAEGGYNRVANYDYLAYLFSDLAKFPSGAQHLVTVQAYDEVASISKLLPFTTHASLPRRLGVAATLKNTSFVVSLQDVLLEPPIDVLPAILRPLMSGGDHYADEETDALPEELQLLEPSVQREQDAAVLKTHLETLMILTGTLKGRQVMRTRGVYCVVRECHLAVEDEGVREACDRLVQVLMRDEDVREVHDASAEAGARRTVADKRALPEPAIVDGGRRVGAMVQSVKDEVESDNEDDKIVDVF